VIKKLGTFWNNLQTRILSMFVIFSLLLVGSVSYLLHNQARSSLRESAINRLTNIALLKEAELDRWGRNSLQSLEALAQRPLVRETTGDLITILENGESSEPVEARLVQNHLQPAIELGGEFSRLVIIRAEDGKIVVSTDSSLQGKYRWESQFFQEGLAGSYVGSPIYTADSGEPELHFSTPVRDFSGETTAVLVGYANLDEITAITTQHREFSMTQETYLINLGNLMVSESRYDPDANQRIFVFSSAAMSCLRGDSGSGIYDDYREVSVVGAYLWLPEWEMCLLTEQDQVEAFRLVDELTGATLAVGAGMTLLGLVVGIFFSRSITRPLKELTKGAQEIGRGNLAYQVNLQSEDELGVLARSFNRMSENLANSLAENERMLAELQEWNETLESRVAERTRKLTEAQKTALGHLEESEQAREIAEERRIRYQALFEESPISLWEMDMTGVRTRLKRLTSVNQSDLETYFQEQPQDLVVCLEEIQLTAVNQQTLELFEGKTLEKVQRHLPELFLPSAQTEFISAFAALHGGAVRYSCELPLRTIRGEQIWGSMVISIPEAYQETWEKVLVSINDITPLITVQKALRQEKEFSERVINSIPGVFFVLDEEGKFRRWNDNFASVSGYTGAEVPRLSPGDVFAVEGGRVPDCFLILGSETSTTKMIQFLSRDGSSTPYFLTCIQVHIGGESLIVGTGVDISERIRAEQALEEKAYELKQSNEDLEQFAYVASHDLQEPLRMVASYLQLLEKRYGNMLNAEAREFMDYAVDGATRMKHLINDLLYYSRVDTRGGENKETDLNLVLGRVHTNLIEAIEESQAIITHDPLPTVVADEMQIIQLLQNLVSNAIKFRKEDQLPRIHIKAERNDSSWVISVEDNGIGLKPEYADQIFVLFQRLHNSDRYPGTGIGLAISKKIVERHGGKIWVNSQPGEGAVFSFTLPDRTP
jgi:PAS domain S-box-containing protein